MTMATKIIRAIIMAQIASDAGKGEYGDGGRCRGDRLAKYRGYAAKPHYIAAAIKMINTTPRCGINYYCTTAPDQNGYPSVLVYFDIRWEGHRYQLSFHNPPQHSGLLRQYIGKGRPTRWNKWRGGSRADARTLIEIFGL